MDSTAKDRAIQNANETQQERVWKGDFGHEYTERNTLDVESVDQVWLRNYGVARSTINQSFLSGISKAAKFLEVGCNAGNQLLMLRQMGWTDLSGTELQPFAMEIARLRQTADEILRRASTQRSS